LTALNPGRLRDRVSTRDAARKSFRQAVGGLLEGIAEIGPSRERFREIRESHVKPGAVLLGK